MLFRSAGNNGLKSLHNHIGTDFWRIRIGTDSLTRRQVGDVNFVLSNFNSDEKEIFTSWTVPTAIKLIMSFLDDKIEPLSVKL